MNKEEEKKLRNELEDLRCVRDLSMGLLKHMQKFMFIKILMYILSVITILLFTLYVNLIIVFIGFMIGLISLYIDILTYNPK